MWAICLIQPSVVVNYYKDTNILYGSEYLTMFPISLTYTNLYCIENYTIITM
jgi:hypothetical protein